jgi:DNA-binding transcriptional MerR regulator
MDKSPDAFRTISEVADDLDLPQHVLRFWETRFSQIKPLKRGGGRRYYRPDDVLLLRGIRHLLYGEGYTIKGVQRILREQGVRHVMTLWREDGGVEEQAPPKPTGADFYAPRGDREAERSRLEPIFDRRSDDELEEDADGFVEDEDESPAAAAFAPRRAAEDLGKDIDLGADDEIEEAEEPEPVRPLPPQPAREPAPAMGAVAADVVPLRPPAFAPVVDARTPTPPRDPVELPADDIGRLRALLSELQDCKRILEAAR